LLLARNCELYVIHLDGSEAYALSGLPDGYCYEYASFQP
jgi:hypothetical protein